MSSDLMSALAIPSTATLATQLRKRGLKSTVMAGVRPLTQDTKVVGKAFTLRYAPAREDVDSGADFDNSKNVQRLAVEAVDQGDVLVIDARGDTSAGVLGNILATRIWMRGAAGIVTDGAFRDSQSVAGLPIPTFSGGGNPRLSSTIHYPADMDVPIGCGGVLVLPGDIVVGDADGVVVVPAKFAEEVAHDAVAQEELERFILHKIEGGLSIRGVYPPGQELLEEYETERRATSGDEP